MPSGLDNPVILREEGERSKKALLCQGGKVCVEGSGLFTHNGTNTGHVDAPAARGEPGGVTVTWDLKPLNSPCWPDCH